LAGESNTVLLDQVDARVGLEAARRALLVEGSVALTGPALVVELLPEPSIAAGKGGASLGDLLPGTELVRCRELPRRDGRQVVLVVRDAHRHAWQRSAIAAAGADAIVVETGLPAWRPSGAAGYVATHGS